MNCPHCGQDHPLEGKYCPVTGKQLPNKQEENKNKPIAKEKIVSKGALPKSKAKRFWIALGGLAGMITLAIGAIQIIQTGFIAMSDEGIALTQIYLQKEQSNVLKNIATLQAINTTPGPAATVIAEQITNLESTVQALDQAIEALESRQTPIASEVTIPTQTTTDKPNMTFSENSSLSGQWSWSPGSSESSNYRLSSSEDEITLVAGPQTDLWNSNNSAPHIEQLISGDFEIQVKLNFDPSERWQAAGLGLRSADDPGTWIALRRLSGGENQQWIDIPQTRLSSSNSLLTISYAKTVVYLRIRRIRELISFSVSENGTNWIDLKVDYVFALPDQLRLFLFVNSTSNNGTAAEFSSFHITRDQKTEVEFPKGPISLESVDQPGALNTMMGWFPGGSTDNTFRLADNRLTLIAGPGTDLWGNITTAPYVELPVSNNVQIQVMLNFGGFESWQSAGLGLRSEDYPSNWIAVRSVSSGGGQRGVYVSRNLGGQSEHMNTMPYADDTVYLRIHRSEPFISLFYSSDGENWNPLSENFVMGFPDRIWVFLYVYSTSGNGIQATFSDLTIIYP